MLAMNADNVIFFLALCFTCVSSNDEENSCEDYSDLCKTQKLNPPLGSSVLLPCIFSKSSLKQVSWTHIPEMGLLHLTSEGLTKFLDPRHGRVKAFPNQGSEGNYSIRIDEIKSSDLGCYRCRHGLDCLQVELVAEKGRSSELMPLPPLLLYICIGVTFILLIVGGACYFKCISCCNKRTQNYSVNPVGAGTEAGASAPPLETGRGPANNHMRGADNLVYENDDQGPSHQQGDPSRYHCRLPGAESNLNTTQPTQSTSGLYPNLNQFNFERTENRRTILRFHTELFSRLRQASLSRHFYVNQGEISRQQAMAAQAENQHRGGLEKKKVKEKSEYKNPIYNRSTDQLNHL